MFGGFAPAGGRAWGELPGVGVVPPVPPTPIFDGASHGRWRRVPEPKSVTPSVPAPSPIAPPNFGMPFSVALLLTDWNVVNAIALADDL